MLSLLKNKQIFRITGILIFVYILLSIDLNAILRILYHANLKYIIFATLLILLVTAVKSLRWQLLLKMQGINYSLRDCFIMYYIGLYVGTLTPGRVGDFTKVLYLKKDGHAMSKSMLSVFFDRIFDMVILIVMAYISFFVFIRLFNETDVFYFVIFTLILFSLVIGLMNKNAVLRLMKLAQKSKAIKKESFESLERYIGEFFDGFSKFNFNGVLVISTITLIGWAIYYILMYVLALAIGIDIPFFYLVACVSLSAVITLLPISISGIGTRDALLIFLFTNIGLSSESAVAFSMMILGVYAFNGVIGLFAWLKHPMEL